MFFTYDRAIEKCREVIEEGDAAKIEETWYGWRVVKVDPYTYKPLNKTYKDRLKRKKVR